MKLEDYIHIISDCFGLENYPLQHYAKQNTDNQIRQAVVLNRKIITDLEKILKLQFVSKTQPGNTCFAEQNSELQDDFKQVFTQIDVLDYFYAIVHSSEFQETEIEKNYPKTTREFWNSVQKGEKLRNNNHT
ncbi:MAG: hypothetical protein WCY89_11030 [Flavobacteriaceae bacterium]